MNEPKAYIVKVTKLKFRPRADETTEEKVLRHTAEQAARHIRFAIPEEALHDAEEEMLSEIIEHYEFIIEELEVETELVRPTRVKVNAEFEIVLNPLERKDWEQQAADIERTTYDLLASLGFTRERKVSAAIIPTNLPE